MAPSRHSFPASEEGQSRETRPAAGPFRITRGHGANMPDFRWTGTFAFAAGPARSGGSRLPGIAGHPPAAGPTPMGDGWNHIQINAPASHRLDRPGLPYPASVRRGSGHDIVRRRETFPEPCRGGNITCTFSARRGPHRSARTSVFASNGRSDGGNGSGSRLSGFRAPEGKRNA